MTRKKINYKVADVIYLLILFMLLKQYQKYWLIIKSNSDTIFIAIGILLAFASVYIHRFFFRPSYKDIVSLREKGWKITGYYSSYSLKNEDTYIKSYNLWIKYSLIFLLLELLVLLIVYVLNGSFLDKNMLLVHITTICVLQVLTWILTIRREEKHEKI